MIKGFQPNSDALVLHPNSPQKVYIKEQSKAFFKVLQIETPKKDANFSCSGAVSQAIWVSGSRIFRGSEAILKV
tara:strand:- start:303 stop:524 length:222 start_codon:yes stop_codon:yes gene_type:complete